MKETLEEAAEQLLINDYKKIVGEELNKYELKLIKWLAASSKKYSDDEAFGLIYILETLLDFAGEDKEDSISISTTDAKKIIKLLKQVK